ncbi:MAG: hypothetical protein WDM76_17005 [Limisphaerales bacterium]
MSQINLFDTQSDSYKNWVAISTSDYAVVYPDTSDYTSPGFPEVSGNSRQMIPPIVENGVLLTNLASGNLIVAESDQRGGNQVQVLFTKDYDLPLDECLCFLPSHQRAESGQSLRRRIFRGSRRHLAALALHAG